nr:hypothetical protein [Escherichia coli]
MGEYFAGQMLILRHLPAIAAQSSLVSMPMLKGVSSASSSRHV